MLFEVFPFTLWNMDLLDVYDSASPFEIIYYSVRLLGMLSLAWQMSFNFTVLFCSCFCSPQISLIFFLSPHLQFINITFYINPLLANNQYNTILATMATVTSYSLHWKTNFLISVNRYMEFQIFCLVFRSPIFNPTLIRILFFAF